MDIIVFVFIKIKWSLSLGKFDDFLDFISKHKEAFLLPKFSEKNNPTFCLELKLL